MARRRKAPPPDDPAISEIAWADPPRRKTRYDWPVIADKLRGEPMAWARVFEQDRTSVVNAIRQGAVAAVHPELGFEVRTTHNVREPVRRCDLYMRFNPDKVIPLRSAIRSTREDKT